jgi:nitric oxide reductase large subunit
MVAALKPALVRKSEDRSLLMLFLISSIAIPLFYAAPSVKAIIRRRRRNQPHRLRRNT